MISSELGKQRERREYSVLGVGSVDSLSVRREARGRAKGREKAARRRPIKMHR